MEYGDRARGSLYWLQRHDPSRDRNTIIRIGALKHCGLLLAEPSNNLDKLNGIRVSGGSILVFQNKGQLGETLAILIFH